MLSYLESLLQTWQKYGFRDAAYLKDLLSNNPDAKKVRNWMVKNPFPNFDNLKGSFHRKEIACQIEPWEVGIWCLCESISSYNGISLWEAASSEERFKHSNKVAKKARELARLLESAPTPYYPPVLMFFDEDRARDIISAMPPDVADALLSGTRYSPHHPGTTLPDGTPIYRSAAKNLASRFLFPDAQEWPALLRKLAQYADTTPHEAKRDSRPSVGNPDARAFARHIDDHFYLFYKRHPNEITAACVNLRFPGIGADEKTIRDWRKTDK